MAKEKKAAKKILLQGRVDEAIAAVVDRAAGAAKRTRRAQLEVIIEDWAKRADEATAA